MVVSPTHAAKENLFCKFSYLLNVKMHFFSFFLTVNFLLLFRNNGIFLFDIKVNLPTNKL